MDGIYFACLIFYLNEPGRLLGVKRLVAKRFFSGGPPGFTMMETLLALGLLSLVVLFSTAFLVTVLQTNTFSQNRTGALALAQEKIEYLKAIPASQVMPEMEPDLYNGNLETLFERETSIYRSAGGSTSLVLVKVSWPGMHKKQRHTIELATQLAD